MGNEKPRKNQVKFELASSETEMSNVGKYSVVRKMSMFSKVIKLRKSVELRRIKIYSKTTRMLLLISTSFLLLNTPIAYSKVRYYFNNSFQLNFFEAAHYAHLNSNLNFTRLIPLDKNITPLTEQSNNENLEANLFDELIERVSCYIYYFNFSFNFFLYVLNGSKFRKTFFEIVLKKCYLNSNWVFK